MLGVSLRNEVGLVTHESQTSAMSCTENKQADDRTATTSLLAFCMPNTMKAAEGTVDVHQSFAVVKIYVETDYPRVASTKYGYTLVDVYAERMSTQALSLQFRPRKQPLYGNLPQCGP